MVVSPTRLPTLLTFIQVCTDSAVGEVDEGVFVGHYCLGREGVAYGGEPGDLFDGGSDGEEFDDSATE